MSNDLCVCCQKTINSCRIHCTECTTVSVDLCVQCFACGAEVGPHKRDHSYEILDSGHFCLFDERSDSSWKLNEECLLLDAVEQFGFGNWEDVSNHVRTRSAEDCQIHYYTYFIQGRIGPKTVPRDLPDNIIDHTGTCNGDLSPSLPVTAPIIELTSQEQREFGYLPLRDDFEIEYDNDAEKTVSDLTLNYHEDDETDLDIKLLQIEAFRERLEEREKRKHVARVHNIISSLLPSDKKFKTDRSNSKRKSFLKNEKGEIDCEISEKFRNFAQFHNEAELSDYVLNLKKIKQLKQRIKELQRYRRNGIQKFSECSKFNSERLKNDKRNQQKRKLLFSCKSAKQEKRNDRDCFESGRDVTNGRVDSDRLQAEILSDSEKKLCNSIDMKPNTYLTIKTCIIKDYLQRRQGLPVKMRYPSHLDKAHRRKILTFLTHNGWIGSV
ncbi:DgyrCDS2949 [Dimorphilus gyrociliatus]|uniref:DgyrCDS2949 n=1 Tax=Dimorphilus gyrociliatus TaxID=2664684 RepID=A0A7I8VDM8_9ANNE|nr:DgyrCDS2949 [Dimorphilus gyrociliatus]